MRWLLIDTGNSRVKWSCIAPENDVRSCLGAQPLGPALSSELCRAWRDAELPASSMPAVDAVFGCSVASAETMRAIESAVAEVYGSTVEWLGAQPAFETNGLRLRNGYRNTAQLGTDRWHALIAARAAYPARTLVVVGAGTATTVDCVLADGRFVGGVIAPGARLMFEGLARGTAQLPHAVGKLVAHPDNTDDAIASGVLGALLGLIERRVKAMLETEGGLELVLGGGFADDLLPHLELDPMVPVHVEHNLVLRGVQIRARARAQNPNQASDRPQP